MNEFHETRYEYHDAGGPNIIVHFELCNNTASMFMHICGEENGACNI
jgi:hypothetical protein